MLKSISPEEDADPLIFPSSEMNQQVFILSSSGSGSKDRASDMAFWMVVPPLYVFLSLPVFGVFTLCLTLPFFLPRLVFFCSLNKYESKLTKKT